ncbi:uncharacterized protein LOC108622062 [Ceratina calcarata]|uniref:Uncharacterized protein LOC108622062 n=1 Tax=Ceratina calcarata TaxID=156304 RepID=A0AAJ7IS56_9HYME|nr:uncharacterized protein LOC108622062 [Ceratina calcarata]
MNLLIFLALVTLALADPGLLRVPKVYNAVITSNQNLSPSRAYPVIQPVIHRTAVGYVPPIYYTQVAPHLAESDVPYLSQGAQKPNQPENQASATTIEQSKPANVEDAKDVKVEANTDPKDISSKPKAREQEPFSFYPNYQSLYYDPYFYTYNGLNPQLVPGTYYADYQPYGTLEPIPASTPKNGLSEHLLPAYHEEKKLTTNERKEKIPDVPPPPLPTAVPKSS